MLFIQTINYCLEQIQLHFEGKLSLNSGIDYETALSQKFAVQFVDDNSKRVPKTILKGIACQEEREKLNSNGSNPDVENIDAQDDKKLPIKGSESLEENWTDIPEMGGEGFIKEKIFYKQSASHNQASIDETALRFGGSWGALVSSTYDEFVHISINNLKKEELSDIKMLILARYARQLQIINAWGIKILEAREARINKIEDTEKLKQNFLEKPVDAWLLSLANAAADEANLLLEQALKSTSVALGWGLSFSSTSGTTEDTLFACTHTMMSMHKYICAHDEDAYFKFEDIFPKQLEHESPLNIGLRDLGSYFIQNFFSEGTYLAHCKRGVIFSPDVYTFTPEKAEMKRNQGQELLRQLEQQEKDKGSTHAGYWEEALKAVDATAFTHANHAITASGFFKSYLSLSQDRFSRALEEVHKRVASHAPRDTKSKHRDCKF